MAEISFNRDKYIDSQNDLQSIFIESLQFNEKLFRAFSEAYSTYIKTILYTNNLVKGLPETETILKSRMEIYLMKDLERKRFRYYPRGYCGKIFRLIHLDMLA